MTNTPAPSDGGEKLACPFCGLNLQTDDEIGQTRHPRRTGCIAQEISFASDRTDMIAQWNRRAPMPQESKPDCPLCGWYRSEGEAHGCSHPDCEFNPYCASPLDTSSPALLEALKEARGALAEFSHAANDMDANGLMKFEGVRVSYGLCNNARAAIARIDSVLPTGEGR